VKDAVAAAQGVLVGEVVQKDMGFVPPVHLVVTDASGKSVVLEYVGGALKVHDNPFGVMANSPTFDWHMTNLSNYVTLSKKYSDPVCRFRGVGKEFWGDVDRGRDRSSVGEPGAVGNDAEGVWEIGRLI